MRNKTLKTLKRLGWKTIHENKKGLFALRLDENLKAEFGVWRKVRNEKFSFFNFSPVTQPRFLFCEPFTVKEDDMSEGIERVMSRMMGESRMNLYIERQRALDFHISDADDSDLEMDMFALTLQNRIATGSLKP